MDQYQQAALDHANQIRRDVLKLEPLDALLPGIPGDAANCPVAAAMRRGSNAIITSFKYTLVNGVLYSMPHDAFVFQLRFDQGEYPELFSDLEHPNTRRALAKRELLQQGAINA